MNSVWTVNWDPRAVKDLKNLSSDAKKRIFDFIEEKLHLSLEPKAHCKPLTGDKVGLWRYRVGDYKIICKLTNHTLKILIVKVSHRKDVYD